MKIGENEPIVCTPEHPFYVLNVDSDTPVVNFEGRDNNQYQGQWTNAGNLKAGMKVLLSNGKNDIIRSVENEELNEPMATYNFEVEDLHNYYVGTKGILVHNACGGEMQGAVEGIEKTVTLQPGHQLDRYGDLTGRYMTDLGTPADKLALPPSNSLVKTSLEVVKPLQLQSGIVAPQAWGPGGAILPGGGVQYFTPNGVQSLIDAKYLKII